jgi:hypothetical protein
MRLWVRRCWGMMEGTWIFGSGLFCCVNGWVSHGTGLGGSRSSSFHLPADFRKAPGSISKDSILRNKMYSLRVFRLLHYLKSPRTPCNLIGKFLFGALFVSGRHHIARRAFSALSYITNYNLVKRILLNLWILLLVSWCTSKDLFEICYDIILEKC